MEERWSLNALYESFETEKFNSDLNTYKKLLDDIVIYAENNFSDTENAGKKLEGFIALYLDVLKYAELLLSFARLILSVDVNDENAVKTLDVLEELTTRITGPEVAAMNFVSKVAELDTVICSSSMLQEHTFAIYEMKQKAEHLLSEAEEICIAKMETTGSAAWEKLRDQLTATLKVDITIDGAAKSEPLTVIRNYAHSPDAELRKNAYECELKAYEAIDKSAAACLNAIKGEVLTVSALRGFASPLEMTLKDARMDRNTLDSLINAIKKYLPAFERFFRHKAKLLGHNGALPFYDLFAPLGKSDTQYTYDEAKGLVVKNFSLFSQRLGEYAQRAFVHNWIDVYPREGKTGGAFCSGIHPIGESRIMLNFGGTFQDVTTLAHELGHGFHNECLKGQTLLNSYYTMPIAETASTFCETILINAALKDAPKETVISVLNADLTDAAQVIVDIYSRYLFETEVFEQRKDGSVSVDELKEMMIWAQKEAYGGGLDHNILHPYAWLPKSHYYYAHSNFYNFPYAYGFLFSKGLYAKYLREGGAFVKDYEELLAFSGQNDLRGVGLKAGIDVRDGAFWESSLKLVEREIDEFIGL